MSYQVLARKYRPRNFETLIGQEHVVRILQNALEKERLHHAYLFTGTRGVGKTTIARILAKCLNCETGITATPCGKCSACQEIDSGRFIDLIEVDAASRTKVEDTRELLNNVQYAPTRGRFKIYLIDEVHMLSGHSFNALLKTLEEPPEHVKFLLATTNPQKLPITVLSRCLQFHLTNLPTERIDEYLKEILQQETIPFDPLAIKLIARAANGSMRDALSLLDQAISFGHGEIKHHDVSELLGTIEIEHIQKILDALANQDGKTLIEITAKLAEQATDFHHVLKELLSYLHAIAVVQVVPDAPIVIDADEQEIREFSERFTKENIQLYYQMALMGRRDLPLASNLQNGFEMILLRMLAFCPQTLKSKFQKAQTAPVQKNKTTQTETNEWPMVLSQLKLTGMAHALAANCTQKNMTDNAIELALHPSHAALLNEKLQKRLNEALNKHFGKTLKLQIHIEKPASETPAEQQQRQMSERHQAAVKHIENDPTVQALIDKLDASVEPELVKPAD